MGTPPVSCVVPESREVRQKPEAGQGRCSNVERCLSKITCLQKLKQRATTGRSNSTPGIYPRELKTGVQTKLCTQMFTAALLFITAKGENSPNVHQLLKDKQLLCIHTLEHHSAIKRTQALTHTT